MKVAANHWNEEQVVWLWSFMRGSDASGGGNWHRCGDILAILKGEIFCGGDISPQNWQFAKVKLPI